jgi:hypothetical protein
MIILQRCRYLAERDVDMTEPASNIVRRPGSVTVVVVLTIISGVLTLLGALFLLLLGGPQALRLTSVAWQFSSSASCT